MKYLFGFLDVIFLFLISISPVSALTLGAAPAVSSSPVAGIAPGVSRVPPPTPPQAPSVPAYHNALQTSYAEAVADYKTWFKMDVPVTQLGAVTLQLLNAYYDALAQCTRGTYNFPSINDHYGHGANEPLLKLNHSNIIGMDEHGLCNVTMAISLCRLTPEELSFIVTKKFGAGVGSYYNQSDLQVLGRIMKQSCTPMFKH
jgi:hypothetical protein